MSIRINLLADVGQEVASPHRTESVLASALIVASLGTLGSVYSAQSSQVQAMANQRTRLESELSALRQHAAVLLTHQKEQARIEKKIKLIQGLTSSQSQARTVRILDDLSVHTPKFVWLTEFTESAGSAKIEGRAIDNQTVASFAHNLAQSPYFENIEIRETIREQTQATSTGAPSLTRFLIESGVNEDRDPLAGVPLSGAQAGDRQVTQEKADQLREFIEQADLPADEPDGSSE